MELTWVYPDENRHSFVLSMADGTPFGEFHFDPDPSAPSTAAVDGRRWTFEHTRAQHPAITIRSESGEPVAEFTPHLTGGGIVIFAGGPSYSWTHTHLGSPRWCFRCEQQKSAVCVTQQAGPLTGGAKVFVCSDAADRPETPVLVLLAWYLRILEFDRLSASVTLCE